MANVYVFQSGVENLHKIGRTRRDVEKRHQDISAGNPHHIFPCFDKSLLLKENQSAPVN